MFTTYFKDFMREVRCWRLLRSELMMCMSMGLDKLGKKAESAGELRLNHLFDAAGSAWMHALTRNMIVMAALMCVRRSTRQVPGWSDDAGSFSCTASP